MKKLLFVQLVVCILLVVGGCPQEVEDKEEWGKKIPPGLEGVWFVEDNNLDINITSVNSFRVFYFKPDGYVYVYRTLYPLVYKFDFDNGCVYYSNIFRCNDNGIENLAGSYISNISYSNKKYWIINLDQKFRYEVSDQDRIRFFTEALAGSDNIYKTYRFVVDRILMDDTSDYKRNILYSFLNKFNIKYANGEKYLCENDYKLNVILGNFYFLKKSDFYLNINSHNEWFVSTAYYGDNFINLITWGFFDYADYNDYYDSNAFYILNKNNKYEHQVIDYKINKNDQLEVKYSVETSLGTVVFNRMRVWEGPDSSDSGWKTDKIELLNRTLEYFPIDVNLGKFKNKYNHAGIEGGGPKFDSGDIKYNTLYVKGEPSVLWLYAD